MILHAAALYWMITFQPGLPSQSFRIDGPYTRKECAEFKRYVPTGKCIPARPLE